MNVTHVSNRVRFGGLLSFKKATQQPPVQEETPVEYKLNGLPSNLAESWKKAINPLGRKALNKQWAIVIIYNKEKKPEHIGVFYMNTANSKTQCLIFKIHDFDEAAKKLKEILNL